MSHGWHHKKWKLQSSSNPTEERRLAWNASRQISHPAMRWTDSNLYIDAEDLSEDEKERKEERMLSSARGGSPTRWHFGSLNSIWKYDGGVNLPGSVCLNHLLPRSLFFLPVSSGDVFYFSDLWNFIKKGAAAAAATAPCMCLLNPMSARSLSAIARLFFSGRENLRDKAGELERTVIRLNPQKPFMKMY